MNIANAGACHLGLSDTALLARHNSVTALDIMQVKVDLINAERYPIENVEVKFYYLAQKRLNPTAIDKSNAYASAHIVRIVTPIDSGNNPNYFKIRGVEVGIKDTTKIKPLAFILIKSTLPVGYPACEPERFNVDDILCSSEFMYEGNGLHDSLSPSIISAGQQSQREPQILLLSVIKQGVSVLFISSTQVESIKLFIRAYLVIRIAYCHVLDICVENHRLGTHLIIEGVGWDLSVGAIPPLALAMVVIFSL